MSPKTSAPGPGNEGGKPVSFNKGDAIRIASAVQKVERGDRGLGPSKLPRAVGGGGGGGMFRVQINEDNVLTCGGYCYGQIVAWNGEAYAPEGEDITVHDPLFLISSAYGATQRLWCANMGDREDVYEVVMPGSSCSCTGVSRERLAGMVFEELEQAETNGFKVVVVEQGCLKIVDTTSCTVGNG